MLQKKLTWLTSVFENLFFSGIFFGWASLLPILKNEGFFSCLSSVQKGINKTEVSCDEHQDEQLSLVFTLVSSIGQFSTIITGMLLDKLGIWRTRTILINASVVCFAAVTVATPVTSYLLYFAFPLIHSTGFALMISNLQISNLFTKSRNLYISLASGAFDSASLAFLVMNKVYFGGIGFSVNFAVYTVFYFLLNFRTFTLMPKDKVPAVVPKGFKYGFRELLCFKKSNGGKDSEKEERSIKHIPTKCKENLNKNNSYFYCIKQGYFISVSLSLSVSMLLTIFYISNFNNFISTLTTERQKSEGLVDFYVMLFGLLQCAGILACPIVGWLSEVYKNKLAKSGVDKKSVKVKSSLIALFLGSFCIILMQACTLFNSLQLQMFAMVMQVLGKVSILFGINQFVSLYFPVSLFGKLYGTMAALAAAALLLQQPLVVLLNKVLAGKFFYLNVGLTAVSLLTLALPLVICWKLRGGKKFSV